jgi:hypothetical protein
MRTVIAAGGIHFNLLTEVSCDIHGIRDQGSGIRDQKSGIRNQESEIRNQESGIRNYELVLRL